MIQGPEKLESEKVYSVPKTSSWWQVNEEKIKSNYGIFEEEVKRLDDKNQQFSDDVKQKHEYIKELIGDTKKGLQVKCSFSYYYLYMSLYVYLG